MGPTNDFQPSPTMDEDSRLAWLADVVDVLAGRDAAIANRYRLVEPDDLHAFLSNNATYQIVTGARGMGKTAALFFKATHLGKDPQYRLVLPTHPFIFRLPALSIIVPEDRIPVYESHRAWTPIWTLVLGSLLALRILRDSFDISVSSSGEWLTKLGVDLNAEEAKFFEIVVASAQNPHRERVTTLISWLIDKNIKPEVQDIWFKRYIDKHLVAPETNDRRYCIFVDAIDEALGIRTFAGSSASSGTERIESPKSINAKLRAEQLWISAQTGFAEVTYRFRTQHDHRIQIFGSMRPEAVEQFPTKANLTESKVVNQMILPLRYEDGDLQTIFERNVVLTSTSGLARPEAANEVERFLGSTHILNRVVWGEREGFVPALIRHSFGSPRDVVMMGGYVRKKVRPQERINSPGVVMDAINVAAKDVLKEHLDNVYPPWDARYGVAFQFLRSNILDREEMERIEKNFAVATAHKLEPLFEYLYLRQLICVPYSPNKGAFKLRYHDPTRPDTPYPRSPNYCALHPALAAAVRDRISDTSAQRDFYKGDFIVSTDSAVPERVGSTVFHLSGTIPDSPSAIFVRGPLGHRLDKPSKVRTPVNMVLLKAILCALRRHANSKVSYDEIANEAKWLASRGYVPKKIGKNDSEDNRQLVDTGRHFLKELDYREARKQPYSVRTLKEALTEYKLDLVHGIEDGLFWLADKSDPDGLIRQVSHFEVRIDLTNN